MATRRTSRTSTDPLTRYRAKRDFARTPEPKGRRARAAGRSFVVQKHDASRLHYDFRLELDGVLKSWAVTRGPSLDPADRRLAVRVEDHPLDYGSFEGVIPEGQYGGGTVMLWDRGSWEPVGDPQEGLKKGDLKFVLHGQRLEGEWVLVRMKGRREADRRQARENWLLIKHRDEAARAGKGDVPLERETRSVATGRTIEEIARARDRVWDSQASEKDVAEPSKRARALRAGSIAKTERQRQARGDGSAALDLASIEGARRAKLSAFVKPQLATLVDKAPAGDAWLHELKLDGYRIQCGVENGTARMLTRNGLDWTRRFGVLAREAGRLPVRDALIDGEVVATNERAVIDFNVLQQRLSEGRDAELVYYAFDLIHCDGFDLRGAALDDRKRALAALFARPRQAPHIRFSEHHLGDGAALYDQACRLGVEGVVSKLRKGTYVSGRGRSWLKSKCIGRQEFVVGGFTEPRKQGRGTGIGALLVGHFDDGTLRYAGRVGTGFDQRQSASLRKRLNRLVRDRPAFPDLPREARKDAIWVRPELACEVEFRAWTADNVLRQASFKGLREDKMARSIGIENPVGSPKPSPRNHGREASGDEIAGVKLTHPGRVLYPEQGLTKRDLAAYYEAVADWALPHLANRPVSLVRCPEGREGQCFFQRHPGAGVPDTIRRLKLNEKGKPVEWVVIDDLAGLIGLVQIGVLEIHLWGAQADDVERPDRIVFDLDPAEDLGFEAAIAAARAVRDRLSELDLESFVKTTGGKGLHVVVPVARRHGWDEVKAFSRALAQAMAKDVPDRYVATTAKAARKGKVFIDYLRNDRGSSAVAPYSTRARAGATVATPVAWDELDAGFDPRRFSIGTVPDRLARLKRDPWREIGRVRQSITAKMRSRLGI